MNKFEIIDSSANPKSDFSPIYQMSEDELRDAEDQLFAYLKSNTATDSDVYTVWLPSGHSFSNIVRHYETEIFPEIPEIVESYEDRCLFLAVVDMRDVSPKVVHGFRFSSKGELSENFEGKLLTGMPFIDDIINSNQDLTAEMFFEYYRGIGVDLDKSISVETNFRIDKVDDYNGVPISQVGYLALFNYVNKQEINHNASIFAHLNIPAIKSLGAIGVTYKDIAEIPGLKTPTIGGEFDSNYSPVDIPFSEENVHIFEQLSVICAPSIEVE